MTQKKLTCNECGLSVANTSNVLARHIRSVHSIEWVDYVVKHEFAGKHPTCMCGCGGALEWKKGGFGKYLNGHDGQRYRSHAPGPASAGWFANPFSGKEEHVATDDEASFISHCITHGDDVTCDHGIKIPWTDSSGIVRFIMPVAKHMKKNIVFIIDSDNGTDASRKHADLRSWAATMHAAVLILRRSGEAFDVVAAFNYKGHEK